jgi:hypothetical protein
MTIEELLELCAESNSRFHVSGADAKVLWDHIEDLRMQAEDDRGVL